MGLQGAQTFNDYLPQFLLEVGVTLTFKPSFYIGSTESGEEFIDDQQVIDSRAAFIKTDLAQ